MRTRVAIIGGGPSGLPLSQLPMRAGVETVALERRTREHVLARIRAGVLEAGTVALLAQAGVGDRVRSEGQIHEECFLADEGRLIRIALGELCGRNVTVHGQTEVTRDLYEAQDAAGARIPREVKDVALHDLDTERPFVTFRQERAERRLPCEIAIGCDGFHGVSRRGIPAEVRREVDRTHPFGRLGVLSRTPPVSKELIYARHPRGFALCSMRNPFLSRYYVQVPLADRVEDWSDDAFWQEPRRRLPPEGATCL